MRVDSIGGRLRVLREEAGLSQAELGKMLGRDQAAVARWESGAVEMKESDIHKVSGALGVHPTNFFSDHPWDMLSNALRDVRALLPTGDKVQDKGQDKTRKLHVSPSYRLDVMHRRPKSNPAIQYGLPQLRTAAAAR